MAGAALDWQAVAAGRSGRWAAAPVVYRSSLDSTNTLAAQLLTAGIPQGTAIVTDYQYAGRGRLARRWQVEPYSALTVTIVLGPLQPTWIAPLVCGLAALDALISLGIKGELKWPNDLLLSSKKCGGILVEAHPAGDEQWLLAGIGLNVRSVDPSLEFATYLDAHTATPVSRENLLSALLIALDRRSTEATAESAALRMAWRTHLVTLGGRVVVTLQHEQFEALAIDISDEGGLIVRKDDGSLRLIQAGDVTLSGTRPTG